MAEKTLLKGLAVLEALAKSDKPRGVSDLSRALGLSKTATHRLLQTLVGAGYVFKDDASDAYLLTTKTWEIGSTAVARLDVKRTAATYLPRLAESSRESVHITILDGAEVVYVDKIDSPHPLRTYSSIGGRAPATCVATGKALLAFQPEEVLHALPSNLKRYTKRTITTRAALLKDLATIRRKGYAVNNCEWREDICSVGAPIFNAQRSVVAALGISGPVSRIGGSLEKLGKLVAVTANEISREMGFRA